MSGVCLSRRKWMAVTFGSVWHKKTGLKRPWFVCAGGKAAPRLYSFISAKTGAALTAGEYGRSNFFWTVPLDSTSAKFTVVYLHACTEIIFISTYMNRVGIFPKQCFPVSWLGNINLSHWFCTQKKSLLSYWTLSGKYAYSPCTWSSMCTLCVPHSLAGIPMYGGNNNVHVLSSWFHVSVHEDTGSLQLTMCTASPCYNPTCMVEVHVIVSFQVHDFMWVWDPSCRLIHVASL